MLITRSVFTSLNESACGRCRRRGGGGQRLDLVAADRFIAVVAIAGGQNLIAVLVDGHLSVQGGGQQSWLLLRGQRRVGYLKQSMCDQDS